MARLLAGLGAVVIDADALAREVVAPGTPGLAAVAAEFGDGVLTPEGALDRGVLAAVVFSDAQALERLNAITHPLIAARAATLMAAAPADAIVVYDVPLLAEGVGRKDWDRVIVVDAPDDLRISRLLARGLSEAEARARMAHQATREQRLAVADIVIDNSGDLDDLAAAVTELWTELTQVV